MIQIFWESSEALTRVEGESIAKSPVLAPFAFEGLVGIFQGNFDNVVQDKLPPV